MKKLYSARSIYRHVDHSVDGHSSHLFEERIIILEGESREDVISQAESEGLQYASQFDNVTYAGYVDVFEIQSSEVGIGSEFYSLIRRSNLDIADYVDRFYDTGNECEREIIDRNPGPSAQSHPPIQ